MTSFTDNEDLKPLLPTKGFVRETRDSYIVCRANEGLQEIDKTATLYTTTFYGALINLSPYEAVQYGRLTRQQYQFQLTYLLRSCLRL